MESERGEKERVRERVVNDDVRAARSVNARAHRLPHTSALDFCRKYVLYVIF